MAFRATLILGGEEFDVLDRDYKWSNGNDAADDRRKRGINMKKRKK